MNNPEQITYFADTDARNKRVRFGIKAKDRTRHVYIIGKTGMGKSTILENMAAQDIQNNNGLCFIDPHGSAIDEIIQYVPKERVKDVLYFAPFDMENPISFNVMEDVGYDKRHLVVSGLMSTFKKIWVDAWSARMEYILGNTLLALLEYPNTTLLDVNKMLSDKSFRNKVVNYIKDPAVKNFWVEEFARYTERMAAEATPAIQNKIGQFTANPLIRNIIGQPKSSFDFRELMDDRKIVLVNLSKGRVGESNANLLGSMLITKIYLSAMSRADRSKKELADLPNFYLYVDEFQNFANESFADILSEARKYNLNLTIAHQYIEQMSDEVRAAVFGNVGTMITFRVGSYDAEVLEKEFLPTFEAADIVNLGAFQIYLRLMINGIGSHPFSARTIPPLETPDYDIVDEVIQSSREQFARPRADVEREMEERAKENFDSGSGAGSGGNNGGGNGKNGGNGGKNNGNVGGKNGNGGQNSGNKNGNNGNNNNGGGNNTNNNFKNKKPVRVLDKKALKEIDEVMAKKRELMEKGPVSDEVNKKENERDENLEVSLKDLQKNTRNGNGKADKKGPSKENSNSLKDVLSGLGVLGGSEKGGEKKERRKSKKEIKKEVKRESSENNSEPAPNQPKKDPQKNQQQESPKQKPNEVSEKELREILEG
ncbi:type IV secretory system conjugative DNA transfer family protein [Candidatus Parcubacteria bacterium]|nr:type IV secretory system conjugative DNA transfer family protein [Candidatus Parcubacteria bacterium]